MTSTKILGYAQLSTPVGTEAVVVADSATTNKYVIITDLIKKWFSEVNADGNNLVGVQNIQYDLSTATTALDFANDELQEISIVADTTFTCTGYVAGKSKSIKITTDATLRTLTFPAAWRFVGPKPIDQAASKIGMLTITSYTAAEAGIVAAYAVEQ